MLNKKLSRSNISAVIEQYVTDNTGIALNMVVIGANNGMIQDFLTPYLLYPNIKSLLVEPVKQLYTELQLRFSGFKNVHIENAAVYKKNGKKAIYHLECDTTLPYWAAGIGSFDKATVLAHADQITGLDNHLQKEIVNCITYAKLLAKHGFTEVDILQIDTEGYDYEIIKSIDFENLRPYVIIFEILHLTLYDYHSVIDFLKKRSYKIFDSHNSYDLIAISK